jgi:hypothetical protein
MQAARVGADQTAAMLSDEGARLKAAARTADADATAARAEAAQVDGSTPKSTLGVPQGLVPLEYLGVTVCTPGVPREYSVGLRCVCAHCAIYSRANRCRRRARGLFDRYTARISTP